MAEISTIARPYAEALFKAVPAAQAAQAVRQLDAVVTVWSDARVQSWAENPSSKAADVQSLLLAAAPSALPVVGNFVQVLIENKRLRALPEVASQFADLVRSAGGARVALVESPYELDAQQLADLQPTLERRFGGRLELKVRQNAELIGGVRVTVGDEVLDTSVLARLGQLRAALTA
ncbi:F0F1 ATP synthase subunit delta [Amphibiibacter pelophylacis]|uniref:F0F1 ATP synthase subunit delta n=1 Tax=Amphibiibacter pelophylacis TaxID=1799477 RepID=A0ACC6P229_9BURK